VRVANAVERLDTARRLQLVALKQVFERSENNSASAVGTSKFRLTTRWPSVFLVRIAEDQLQFTSDMKKIFIVSMLIAFAMICACQKQNSAAEQQLAQRKAELDAREKALDEREKPLAEREKATTNIRRIPAEVQGRIADPSQLKAERDRRIQQLPPDVQKLIPNPAQVQAEREKRRQQMLEQVQRMRSGSAGSPAATFTNPSAASPAAEATSPTPSPTPQ
jgi:hypothetical protein